MRVAPNTLIANALLADNVNDLPPQIAGFRRFADSTGADCKALAAQALAAHQAPIPLQKITAETLVVAGDNDPLASNPATLAEAIPGAGVYVGKGDHMSAIADRGLQGALFDFLLG